MASIETQDQRLFWNSFDRCLSSPQRDQQFAEDFYQRLYSSDRAIAEIFDRVSVSDQLHAVRQAVYLLQEMTPLKQAEITLDKIQAIHHQHEIRLSNAMLDKWLECLLASVELADPEFNETVKQAWIDILTPAVRILKSLNLGNCEH